MLDKIKGMKVEEKLKFCFTLIVIISSISGVIWGCCCAAILRIAML